MNGQSKYWNCPVGEVAQSECVTLAQGEGGKLTRRLLEQVVFPNLGAAPQYIDAARLVVPNGRLAFSTDSYVVSPLVFPGGDIGKLAVIGTVNDLSVSGAIPRWLSLSLIIEEGLPIALLKQILQSVAQAARDCHVEIVAGDTKVVPHGEADGLFLNTSGIGVLGDIVPPGPEALQNGDVLIVSGPLGRHGIAILAAREQLDFQPPPVSDCASLTPATTALLQHVGTGVRAMRDATRGGLTTVLHEWAAASGKSLFVEEKLIRRDPLVTSACELLGLEPLHLACEGTMVVAIESSQAETALQKLRSTVVGMQAAVIGTVMSRQIAPVVIRRALGREQSLDEPSGSPLPRIC